MKKIESISQLASLFSTLPGVGAKTAQRYAYSVIDWDEERARSFCEAIMNVKNTVRRCSVCNDFTDKPVCDICSTRDSSVICVVSYPKDVIAMEKVSGYKGVYHVLNGTISPLDGRGPEDIDVKGLLRRLNGVKEVIMATNPDVEGEATAIYISRLIKPLGIKVSRIAQGISMGSEVEYADEVTLTRAMESRTEL
ncbi:MAG: recombination protein RecR [Clostridiales bacterium]|nr:recombination protein RecR [Clostridiales bacterium]